MQRFNNLANFPLDVLTMSFDVASSAAWAGAIPIGLATGASVIVTPLVDRFENRPVAIVGVFLCCISCILTSIITDFKLIYVTYSTLYGLGIGFCSLASMDLLLQYFPRKNCSRATLIALVGSSSGKLRACGLWCSFCISVDSRLEETSRFTLGQKIDVCFLRIWTNNTMTKINPKADIWLYFRLMSLVLFEIETHWYTL